MNLTWVFFCFFYLFILEKVIVAVAATVCLLYFTGDDWGKLKVKSTLDGTFTTVAGGRYECVVFVCLTCAAATSYRPQPSWERKKVEHT